MSFETPKELWFRPDSIIDGQMPSRYSACVSIKRRFATDIEYVRADLLAAAEEREKDYKTALEAIIPILGDVDQSHFPVPQQQAQAIAREALNLKGE